ncbi:hypothetical protein MGAST_14520 [Mycobacterium gastri 'Wayne']|nr:hypothetical protein MGAST_14520 [Mycobacterium gastri 'Wayne']
MGNGRKCLGSWLGQAVTGGQKKEGAQNRLCAYLAVAALARRWVLRSGRWSIGRCR